MATTFSKKVTGVVADLSSSGFTKYTWTESGAVGANTFDIASDTTNAALKLTGISGDVLKINGYSGDYTAKLSGSTLTLDNNDQIITATLAKNSVITLQFLDISKEVNLSAKTLGSQSLVTKGSVLHIDGMNSHELTSVTAAVKTALTDKTVTPNKIYTDINAAITYTKTQALTDITVTPNVTYKTLNDAITSNDATVIAKTLTDTTVTPNVTYKTLNEAIASNDATVVDDAVKKSTTGFSTLADLTKAYTDLAAQTKPAFKVEALTPATMLPGSAVAVSEGATAYFKVTLNNRGAGDYSVKTMLTGTLATPTDDFVNSLSLDSASVAAGIKFNAATGILTIPASSPSISAILSTFIKNDLVSPEAGEKVNLILSDAQGGNITPLSNTDLASVTITDVVPPTFSVSPNVGPVLEGMPTTFTVNLANHAVGDYSVRVALTGNNAVLNSDFSALTLDSATSSTIKFDALTGILTIPADAKTTGVKFNTNINTDNRAETGQSITLTLSPDASNAANTNALITSTASSTTTIITDVLPPTFTVSGASSSINEGETASFNISLSNNPDSKSDYSIKTTLGATGAGILGTDFSSTLALDAASIASGIKFDTATGLLTIPAATIATANTAKQVIKATLTITTNPDNVVSAKGMSLALSNPTGTNVATSAATATISVNDVPATQLTKVSDNFSKDNLLPSNTNTLLISDLLTLNPGDSIVDDSTTDNDILNITTGALAITTTNTPTITNIETVNLKALDTVSIDMGKITGVKTFNVKDSTAPVSLTKIPSASMILGLGGSLVNDLNVKYATAPKATDSLMVTLDKATNATFSVDSSIVLDKGFGFAELNIINASTLTSFDGRISTLTISGTGALTVATGALSNVNHIELTDPNIIKFGNITALTTFKAPNNTGGITTGTIQGATGGLTMQLGSGADSITIQDNANASSAINNLKLGSGNDSITFKKGTSGNTYISGDDGNDTITISINGAGSSTSIDTIDGGNGDDTITISVGGTFFTNGGAGNDSITDGAGSNVITGGDGNDTITGGGGSDTITGGAGSDTIYVNNNGTATITDFKIGEDTLIISSLLAKAKVSFAGGSTSYTTVSNSGILDITLASATTVTGSTGNDSITGSIGNDSIDGGLGNDSINAGDGNDNIIGGDGSDSIDGGNGDDTITAGNGVDNIDGGAGNDTISLTYEQLFAGGTSTIDSIDGGSLGTADSLLLTDTEKGLTIASSNIFNSVQRVEQIKTTANRFPISISLDATNNATAQFNTIDLSNDTDARGVNTINSTGASNNISTIIGSAGVDFITLRSSAPATTITGGDGADVFDIGNGGTNTITDLSGTDSLAVSSSNIVNATITANYTAASAINLGAIAITTAGFSVNMGAETGSGTISITNTGSATTLVGGAGSNTINGGAGNDTINGGTGSATIDGGAGNDIITAGAAGTNSITGGYGDDTIIGSSGVDTINVDYGTDTITNLGTNDVLTVNYYATANATLSGTTPSWTATSSTTNAGILTIATAASTTTATVNLSSVTTNTGTININASTATGATTLTGSSGNDSITGGAGADTITGGSGADTITGGAGADTITGGVGADTFNVTAGTDTITDLGDGTDIIVVSSGATATATLSGTTPSWTATSSTTNAGILTIATAASTTTATVDLSSVTTNTGTININASTASSATTFKGAGAGITNITGGSGADAITANSAGTIVGGTGADTLSVATTGALSVSDTDGVAITVSGSTASNITTTGALVATSISGGTGVDTITLAGSISNVATITGGAGLDVINLGASHTGGVKIVLATATADADTITNFIHAVDTIQLTAGTHAINGLSVSAYGALGASGGTAGYNVVFDTSTNLGALGVNIATSGASSAAPAAATTSLAHYAIASDTGAIYYDADGNWSAASVQIGTIGVVTGLAATDFTMV